MIRPLPDAIRTVAPSALGDVVSAFDVCHAFDADPTLNAPRPIVVSIMLHGNEPGGLLALQRILKAYDEGTFRPQRGLYVHMGNVEAARRGARVLEHQPDYNRIWNRGHPRAVRSLELLTEIAPACILDLHNSSGKNPVFSGVNRIDAETLGVAFGFAPQVVHISGPTGLFTDAAARIAPAVVFELGPPMTTAGAERASEYIIGLLSETSLPVTDPERAVVHRNVATLRIDREASMGPSIEDEVAIRFADELEEQNFRMLSPGARLADVDLAARDAISARDDNDKDVFGEFLRYVGGELLTRQPLVPVMMTTDEAVIRRDCWGYLMVRQPALAT